MKKILQLSCAAAILAGCMDQSKSDVAAYPEATPVKDYPTASRVMDKNVASAVIKKAPKKAKTQPAAKAKRDIIYNPTILKSSHEKVLTIATAHHVQPEAVSAAPAETPRQTIIEAAMSKDVVTQPVAYQENVQVTADAPQIIEHTPAVNPTVNTEMPPVSVKLAPVEPAPKPAPQIKDQKPKEPSIEVSTETPLPDIYEEPGLPNEPIELTDSAEEVVTPDVDNEDLQTETPLPDVSDEDIHTAPVSEDIAVPSPEDAPLPDTAQDIAIDTQPAA